MKISKFRNFILHLGLVRGIVLITLVSALASMLISSAINYLANREIVYLSLMIAILVPLIVSPPLSYAMIKLLYELDGARRLANKLAVTDDLTGIANRRFFFERAEQEYQRAIRYDNLLAVVLFDIDDFKYVNDKFGHLAGDQVLRDVCQVCQGVIRTSDIFARYGGEEFIILLPETGFSEAGRLADRLCSTVREQVHPGGDIRMQITISIGVAQVDADTDKLDNLLHRADMALYRAKAGGKDRVVLA